MAREVCGICWCPYDEFTGECACAPEPKAQRKGEHMTSLRQAAQQALEAWNAGDTKWFKLAYLVMDDLRRALAEPTLQTCNCRWDGEVQVQQCTLHEAHVDAIHEWAERAKVAEKKLAALAEPVQEPVANRAFLERILTAMEGVIDVADRKTDEFDALRSCVIDLTLMLHTAPPQRKPLTEEEITLIVADCSASAHRHDDFSFARAIERAHNIK